MCDFVIKSFDCTHIYLWHTARQANMCSEDDTLTTNAQPTSSDVKKFH